MFDKSMLETPNKKHEDEEGNPIQSKVHNIINNNECPICLVKFSTMDSIKKLKEVECTPQKGKDHQQIDGDNDVTLR